MSTYVVDQFAAIRFSGAELCAEVDDYRLRHDHYLFLELGGSSNTTQTHPRTGREVRERDWSLAGMGQKYRVMQHVVQNSTSCEGGMARFASERETLAENYIRRARATVEKALPAAAFNAVGFDLVAKISRVVGREVTADASRQFTKLHELSPAKVDENGIQSWELRPLLSVRDAAIFFGFAHLDGRNFRSLARGSGFEFSDAKLMDLATAKADLFNRPVAA